MATIEIGQVLPGSSFPTHPVYGARRDLKVLEISSTTGRWTLGEITCECGTAREIHPGDHFQVTQCEPCKEESRKQAKAARRANDPERAAKLEAKQIARAQRAEAKQVERDQKATLRVAVKAQKEQDKADAAKAKAALIAKVAAEKQVPVSTQEEGTASKKSKKAAKAA